MATAGLRLLDVATAEAVMESCRELLRESGFRFQDQWATMISGMLQNGRIKLLNLAHVVEMCGLAVLACDRSVYSWMEIC